jgi:hypothetical protein
MPIRSYFVRVGSVLLVLFLFTNWYFRDRPMPPAKEPLASRVLIRIHSDHKWPEKVVFDTRVPDPANSTS